MQYALIQNNVVVNIIEADASFAAAIALDWQHVAPADGAGIGWGWDGVQFMAPQELQPVALQRRVSVLAFRCRFTPAEKATIEWAAVDKPEQTTEQRQQSAMLRATLADQAAATFIDLADPTTVAGVQALQAMGLITADRADAILDAPVQPGELQ